MPKVKIFEITDESLDKLGVALRNHNCRKIIILLTVEKLPISQIAKKLHIGINIASDQVKVLRQLGLLRITRKPLQKKGNDHNIYEFVSDIFVSAVPEENKIKNIFKETVKFASIIVAGAVTYLSLLKEKINEQWHSLNSESVNKSITSHIEEPIILSLLVVIIGLVILYILERKKR